MTLAQSLFLVALSLAILAIAAFAAVVGVGARRTAGGAYLTWGFLRRLASPRGDPGGLNRWAFYAHRVSGAVIFAFLCLHIVDVSLYAFSHALFDNVHQLYGTLPMRVFECGLLFAIAFHTLNGLRLLAVDIADLGRAAAGRALLGVTIATLVLGVAGSVVILRPELT